MFKLMLSACKTVSCFLSSIRILFKLALLKKLKLTLLISTLEPKSFDSLFVAIFTSQFCTIAVCNANDRMVIKTTITNNTFPNIFKNFFSSYYLIYKTRFIYQKLKF